ncbi:hypothetical protein [Xanthomonas phage BUDD]|nr:hypothetical protein [Xanthomonas phage BUDD]
MSEIIRIMESARKFADDNLAEGAHELVRMSETGILKSGGVVRQCASMLNLIPGIESLNIAQTLFRTAALEQAAKAFKDRYAGN